MIVFCFALVSIDLLKIQIGVWNASLDRLQLHLVSALIRWWTFLWHSRFLFYRSQDGKPMTTILFSNKRVSDYARPPRSIKLNGWQVVFRKKCLRICLAALFLLEFVSHMKTRNERREPCCFRAKSIPFPHYIVMTVLDSCEMQIKTNLRTERVLHRRLWRLPSASLHRLATHQIPILALSSCL